MATFSIPSTSTAYLKGSYVTIAYTRMVHVKLSEVYLLVEDRLAHIDDRVNVELWKDIKEFVKNDFQESYNALRRFNDSRYMACLTDKQLEHANKFCRYSCCSSAIVGIFIASLPHLSQAQYHL